MIGQAFEVIGAETTVLPEAGSGPLAWPLVLVALGALVLFGGLGITMVRGPREIPNTGTPKHTVRKTQPAFAQASSRSARTVERQSNNSSAIQ